MASRERARQLSGRMEYIAPASTDDALRALQQQGAVPLGGGTDLLVARGAGFEHGHALVDLRRLPGARDIAVAADGSLRIGAAVRMADLAAHPEVRSSFAALAEAARVVGTPALRSMGTIGGNLCQRPRCWYLRRGIQPCLKNGGDGCAAVDGDSRYHAIFGAGPCHAVHPSDGAVALTALDAALTLRSAGGTRRLAIADFYANAAGDPARETTLAHGEIIEAIDIPAASRGGTQRYTKLMQRGSWDFALVSLAAVKRGDGEVRLVLGGVAPRPWRVNPSVEEDVASGALDDESADALAERAMYDAAPLAMNAYKVKQAATLIRRAALELSRA